MQTIFGLKQAQGQRFLADGKRIPVTEIEVKANSVVMAKSKAQDGYFAMQLGYGTQKKASKAVLGHAKKANLDKAPYFLREVRLEDSVNLEELAKIGDKISANQIFTSGDMVDVSGFSKGKGFAGGVKRHNFKGGPRTHGQSDRERAPGSIGQTTTPGRVYKGKRMAGKMGNENVTLKNLQIVAVTDNRIYVKGLVPGIPGGLLKITKVKPGKNVVALYTEVAKESEIKTEEVATKAKEEESAPIESGSVASN